MLFIRCVECNPKCYVCWIERCDLRRGCECMFVVCECCRKRNEVGRSRAYDTHNEQKRQISFSMSLM